jgi:succinate dehydrogenase/fumarate reductase cytochrome b subunit
MKIFKGCAAGVAMVVTSVMLFASSAMATPPADPTGGAFADGADSASSWISQVGAPAIFVLAAVGLVIAIAIHYFRKLRTAGV